MSKKTALKIALLVLVLVLCGAAALAGSESEAGSPRLESFAPTEQVRADDAVPFPVNI